MNKTVKRPVGRPRTTLQDLPDNWREIVTECGKTGGSFAKMRVLLGINASAWGTLLTDSEEFRCAISAAKEASIVWWEDLGQGLASGKVDGNATSWIFNMKNRAGWRDQVQVDNTSSDGTMTPSRPVTIQVIGVDPEDMEAGNE